MNVGGISVTNFFLLMRFNSKMLNKAQVNHRFYSNDKRLNFFNFFNF